MGIFPNSCISTGFCEQLETVQWGCLGADAGTLLPSSGITQAVWRRELSHKVPRMSDVPVQIDFTVILCGVLSSALD